MFSLPGLSVVVVKHVLCTLEFCKVPEQFSTLIVSFGGESCVVHFEVLKSARANPYLDSQLW
jgi:hypothetical protein